MNKKIATYFSLAIIVLYIVYMVYDTSKSSPVAATSFNEEAQEVYDAKWGITETLNIPFGNLKAISLNENTIVVGGENFLAAYKSIDLSLLWNITTEKEIKALSVFDDMIYASIGEMIHLFNIDGTFIDEWGPYDEESYITSITSNKDFVAFADARNKLIFVVNKEGALKHYFGQPGNQFIVPSPYFDVSFLEDGNLAVANSGKRQIEYRKISGEIIEVFGEEGIGLEEFCGCCNPSHFALLPDGKIVTAEKGINRMKVLDQNGKLVELVSQSNLFKASIPLDIAISKEGEIYAANGADSILYIFKRNN
ncbi:MAG: hypothetical protein PF484_10110 [Bacteroidales bacterium]|jgi:hypothetical protein|nr:hypothetical protein [Bacteroidales bacterium]